MTVASQQGPELAAIVALAQERVIGRDGGMPWHLPADLKYFKAMTLGCPVVMGRKTFESIGRCLPGRDNLVISSAPPSPVRTMAAVGTAESGDTGTTLSWWCSPEAAAAAGVARAQCTGARYCFVIGGGGIYRQLLPYCSRLFVTEIDLAVAGDTVFPDYTINTDYASDSMHRTDAARPLDDTDRWHQDSVVEGQQDARNRHGHRFLTYRRSQRPLPG